MRLDIARLSTVFVVLVTIVTLASLGVYSALKLVVADLQTQVENVRANVVAPSTDSPVVQRLSATLAGDLAPTNTPALDARATQLDHRSDRLLELTAAVALVGMVVAFFTGRPAIEVAQPRDARKPLANTSSNGSVCTFVPRADITRLLARAPLDPDLAQDLAALTDATLDEL